MSNSYGMSNSYSALVGRLQTDRGCRSDILLCAPLAVTLNRSVHVLGHEFSSSNMSALSLPISAVPCRVGPQWIIVGNYSGPGLFTA